MIKNMPAWPGAAPAPAVQPDPAGWLPRRGAMMPPLRPLRRMGAAPSGAAASRPWQRRVKWRRRGVLWGA